MLVGVTDSVGVVVGVTVIVVVGVTVLVGVTLLVGVIEGVGVGVTSNSDDVLTTNVLDVEPEYDTFTDVKVLVSFNKL